MRPVEPAVLEMPLSSRIVQTREKFLFKESFGLQTLEMILEESERSMMAVLLS